MALQEAEQIFVGDALVDAVYIGSTLVWEALPPTLPEDPQE